MSTSSTPESVIWDTTYACPLRCIHCYSESGRRPARQLGHEDMLRVTDAFISMGPRVVALAGGEPLLVKGIFEIADRLVRAGVKAVLYTGGWTPQAVDDRPAGGTRRGDRQCRRRDSRSPRPCVAAGPAPSTGPWRPWLCSTAPPGNAPRKGRRRCDSASTTSSCGATSPNWRSSAARWQAASRTCGV
ncbi:radical SAM protein [Streptomyces sp. L7]